MHFTRGYPVFGLQITRNIISAGHLVSDAFQQNGRYTVGPDFKVIWVWTRGKQKYTNHTTGEIIYRNVGDCNIAPLSSDGTPEKHGDYTMETLEECELWCLSTFYDNVYTVDEFECFKLEQGDSVELPKGTKLFLASGVVYVNGVMFGAVRQIQVTSDSTTVTAETNAYGLIYKGGE